MKTKKNSEVKKIMSNKKTIINMEKLHNTKSYNAEYYHSPQAKKIGKEINDLKKEYIKNNPKDYLIVGVNFHQMLWSSLPQIPKNEQEIFILTGKGLEQEHNQNYTEAIQFYEQAITLNNQVCKEDIEEMIKLNGPGDYIYAPKLKQRVRVCDRKILSDKCKKLEKEAKDLEKVNPSEAIMIYDELNRLKPGLKKYDKRIEICKKKL